MPGDPAILVLCHPTKSADVRNLLPRGGGAFLNEIDGNLSAFREGSIVEFHHAGKLRGADFDPILFELRPTTSELIKDSKGRTIPTVLARHVSAAERTDRDKAKSVDRKRLLVAMLDNPGIS